MQPSSTNASFLDATIVIDTSVSLYNSATSLRLGFSASFRIEPKRAEGGPG
jgi:hypothetical protein